MVGLAIPVAGAAPAPAQSSGGKCPVNALKNAKNKPVEITYWQGGLQRANEEAILRLIDKFNSSQNDVHVTVVNQTTYADTLNKFRAGLSSGDLPDLVQIEDTGLQQMIDTQAVLPAQACVDADKYDMSDNLKRVVDYYSVKGKLWPMPFNVSNPMLLFQQEGVPDRRPRSEQPAEDARRSEVRRPEAQGLGNGLAGRLRVEARPVVPRAVVGARWQDVREQRQRAQEPCDQHDVRQRDRQGELHVPERHGESGPGADQLRRWSQSAFDNLIGIGNGNFAMTIDTSAALGTIQQLLSSGQYPNVELGVAPMPGPKGKGGVLVGGGANYIVKKSSPEKQAAAWQYAKFLNDPENAGRLGVSTGYVPIRQSAADLPQVQQYWAANPGFKVAYDQLVGGVTNTATAGPVIGDYQGVRDAVLDSEQQMFNGMSPSAALKQAKQDANAKIEEYNSRVSG